MPKKKPAAKKPAKKRTTKKKPEVSTLLDALSIADSATGNSAETKALKLMAKFIRTVGKPKVIPIGAKKEKEVKTPPQTIRYKVTCGKGQGYSPPSIRGSDDLSAPNRSYSWGNQPQSIRGMDNIPENY